MSARMRYTSMGEPIPKKVMSTNNTRITVLSIFMYSANPPHTPKSILSVSDFVSRAIVTEMFW